jgi:NAD(P)H-nitrite reductase large subunit
MKTHVIIGAAAAGIGVLNTLIKLDPISRIICISDESENPYNKCFLADYLHKVKQEHELNIVRTELLNNPNVHLFLGIRATKINPAEKTIELSDGTTLPYDTLFIGTGSSPVMPPITGLQDGLSRRIEGCFTFHTIADANKIMAYAKDYGVKAVAIVGAGLSGLECADSLRSWGLDVTVIERSDRVLARQVDVQGSDFIGAMMRSAGAELLCNQTVSEIVHENGRVAGVRLENSFRIPQDFGTNGNLDEKACTNVSIEKNNSRSSRSLEGDRDSVLPFQMVIIATGLKPNVDLARSAGLALRDGYIHVDDSMGTSAPSIFAGGDCVMVLDQITKQYVASCTWPDAMQQGSVAAHGMAQIKKSYPGAAVVTSSAFFGKTLVTCGLVSNFSPEFEVRITQGDDFYHKLVLDQGILKGYLLIGSTAQASKLRRAILTGEKW